MDSEQILSGAGVGQVLDGRYELLACIGRGGMGLVYAARHVELERKFAVKVLHPGFARDPAWLERFRREARATTAIGHENIVDVIDIRVADDVPPYYVMEFLDGESLASLARREGPLPWSRVQDIAVQLCDALAAAHRAGVVHRDLKPANCFRVPRRQCHDFVKVLDFGIAKILAWSNNTGRLTATGEILGTPGYMAPEQVCGGEIDVRTDIYSLAVLLYRLLAGRLPFDGRTPEEVLRSQFTRTPAPIRSHVAGSDVPEAVERALQAALASEPAGRPASMAAFAAMMVQSCADANDEPTHRRAAPLRQPEPVIASAPKGSLAVLTVREPRPPARRLPAFAWFGLAAVLVTTAAMTGMIGMIGTIGLWLGGPAIDSGTAEASVGRGASDPGVRDRSALVDTVPSLRIQPFVDPAPPDPIERPMPLSAAEAVTVEPSVTAPVATPVANTRTSTRGPPPPRAPAPVSLSARVEGLWPAAEACLCPAFDGFPPTQLLLRAAVTGTGELRVEARGTNANNAKVRACLAGASNGAAVAPVPVDDPTILEVQHELRCK